MWFDFVSFLIKKRVTWANSHDFRMTSFFFWQKYDIELKTELNWVVKEKFSVFRRKQSEGTWGGCGPITRRQLDVVPGTFRLRPISSECVEDNRKCCPFWPMRRRRSVTYRRKGRTTRNGLSVPASELERRRFVSAVHTRHWLRVDGGQTKLFVPKCCVSAGCRWPWRSLCFLGSPKRWRRASVKVSSPASSG